MAGYGIHGGASDVHCLRQAAAAALGRACRKGPHVPRVRALCPHPALEAEIPLEGPLGGYTEYVFSDLRFGSTIGWVDDIQVRRHGKPTTFRIMARVAPDGRVSAVRFITTTGAGGDSGWNPPVE
ncbi:MAG: hypothetical protein ACLSAH_04390 [Bilophila wadsworthia]